MNKVLKEKQYGKIDVMVKSIVPMGEKTHRVSIATDKIMSEILLDGPAGQGCAEG